LREQGMQRQYCAYQSLRYADHRISPSPEDTRLPVRVEPRRDVEHLRSMMALPPSFRNLSIRAALAVGPSEASFSRYREDQSAPNTIDNTRRPQDSPSGSGR